MRYLVLELQKGEDESVSHIVTVHETRADAESKFHTVLSFAATSEVYRHSVILMNDEAAVLRSECYRHPEEIPEMEGEAVFPVTNGVVENI